MSQQTGPRTEAGKASSSRNASRHGLTNMKPVVTEADRPEFQALRTELLQSLQPTGFLQGLTVQCILNAAWNMQRCLKLENCLMQSIDGADPLAHAGAAKQAALFQRYYLRFEGAYRANLRELERLQRLQMAQDAWFGEETNLSALHDVQVFQQAAKRNRKEAAGKPTPENFDLWMAGQITRNPELAKFMTGPGGPFAKR